MGKGTAVGSSGCVVEVVVGDGTAVGSSGVVEVVVGKVTAVGSSGCVVEVVVGKGTAVGPSSRVNRRRRSAAALLRLWVRIPPGTWMFVCCECCVLSGSICDALITRPEESYGLWCV